ncbi:MAG: DUF1080 domain-containing protein [Bryobacterales bacterium]|nr:DUF1080 domain-containing protein [Bryobacteraceae bacterium]MDW8353238.1 DUF1080 domain-containing protein [Bryobacterales bacterium]
MRNAMFLGLVLSCAVPAGVEEFNGRWNIAVFGEARSRAWWLEVKGAGTAAPEGWFVGAPGGGLDRIPNLEIRDGELSFSFERAFRVALDRPPVEAKGVWRARLKDGRLEGTFELEGHDVPPLKWIGMRAPVMTDRDDGTWREGKPVELFNGKDLSNWLPMIPGRELGWTVRDGIMVNVEGANNLVSKERFWNFKLHAEFRLGPRSNSGIGLRGRYEVQILDDYGRSPSKHTNGAIYSRIAPSENASRPPGEWQTFDVTLIGRQVTVVVNGRKVIDRQEIEGLTAMAHDPNEAEPGPISLQGDHGVVEFRKITVTPLVR